MKVSRNQLKGIVKECLMEILAEGLLSESVPTPKTKRRSAVAALTEAPPKKDKFAAAVDTAVAGLTNDPIMSSIFRDTAMTTLQDQLGGETNPQASAGTNLINEQSSPDNLDDIFGEQSARWASLAFPEKKTLP